MKKLVLSLAAVLTFGLALAQEREKGTIELAPFVGYLSANYYGEANMNNSALGSVNLGVNADYFFNDRWSLKSGLFYQTNGTDLGANYQEKLNYVTLPVNANWHFGSTRKWNLNFGPSIGFLTSAKSINGRDIKEFVKPTQIGINIGIGYKIFINEKLSILIDHQEMLGVSKIDKTGNTSLKNVNSSFNIGAVLSL